jgi:hypothetical protein
VALVEEGMSAGRARNAGTNDQDMHGGDI